MHRDVPLVEIGDELGTEPRGEQAARDNEQQRARDRDLGPVERPLEHRPIALAKAAHQPVFLLFDLARDEQRDGRRHEGEREKECGGQREDDGNRHRVEGLPFDALEREDRKIDRRDDDDAEDARADDLGACGGHEAEAFVAIEQAPETVLRFAETPQAILDDDHRPVDDQTKVQRAEAHEVCRRARLQHAGQRHQHRDRDDRRRDQCGAEVPEQQEEDDDDEQRPFGEVLLDRPDRPLDERRAIIERSHLDTLGERLGRLFEPFRRRLGDDARVLADQHRHRGEHDLLAILGRRAGPETRADRDIGHILDADGHAAARRDQDFREVLLVTGLAGNADQDLLAAALDIACAAIGIVALQRADDVVEREIERRQRGGIGGDMILAGIAADRVDLRDPGHRAHLRADDPVGHRPQILGIIGRPVRLLRAGLGLDREHEDLAEPRRNRSHFGLASVGELRFRRLYALVHLLAGEVDVGARGWGYRRSRSRSGR